MSSNLFKRGKRADEEYEKKRRSTSSLPLTPSAIKREERARRTVSFLNKPDSSARFAGENNDLTKSGSFYKDNNESTLTSIPSIRPGVSTLHHAPSYRASGSSSVSPEVPEATFSLSVLLKSTLPTLSPDAEAVLHKFHKISPSEISPHLSPLLHLLLELFFRSFALPPYELGDVARHERDYDDEQDRVEELGAQICVSAFNAIVRIICIAFSPTVKQSEAFYRFFSAEITLSSYPLLDEKLVKASLYVLSACDWRSAPAHTLAHALRHVFHVVSIFRLGVSDPSKKLSAEVLGSQCTRVLSILGSVTALGIAAQPIDGIDFCPLHAACDSQPFPAFKDALSASLNLFDCIIKTTSAQVTIPGIRKFFDFTLTTKVGDSVKDVLETVRQFCVYAFPKTVHYALFPTFLHGILSVSLVFFAFISQNRIHK